jgi:hypothetical protein
VTVPTRRTAQAFVSCRFDTLFSIILSLASGRLTPSVLGERDGAAPRTDRGWMLSERTGRCSCDSAAGFSRQLSLGRLDRRYLDGIAFQRAGHFNRLTRILGGRLLIAQLIDLIVSLIRQHVL